MDYLKRFDPIWVAMLFAAGMNYAIIALFDTNLVTEIFGTGTATDVVYVVFGLAALMMLPRLMDSMHLTHHHTHPHGA